MLMGGRLWLILFLLTVAIGVTIFMSGQKEPAPEVPVAEAPLDAAPSTPKKLDDDDPANAFKAPPTKDEIKAAEEAKAAADKKAATAEAKTTDANPFPGTSDSPPGSSLALPSDTAPYPGSPPGPAYAPPIYPPTNPDGGFEGELREPPPEEGDYDPETFGQPRDGEI